MIPIRFIPLLGYFQHRFGVIPSTVLASFTLHLLVSSYKAFIKLGGQENITKKLCDTEMEAEAEKSEFKRGIEANRGVVEAWSGRGQAARLDEPGFEEKKVGVETGSIHLLVCRVPIGTHQ